MNLLIVNISPHFFLLFVCVCMHARRYLCVLCVNGMLVEVRRQLAGVIKKLRETFSFPLLANFTQMSLHLS